MATKAQIGSIVGGKYQLVERLGGGGMGEVFRATHLFAGRTVALKLLRRDFADDAELTRRFFQEAQAANKIRHANIVDVLDAGLADEGPYVAMECLEGASLSAALVRVGPFPLATALAVLIPVLDALDAAHRHGIVHRDLKPENVFLSREGRGAEVRVKVLDFGIAKVLDSGVSPRTNTGVVFGTPDYLSPEQASGAGVLDGRSDLFAIGVVLFELLTGHRPFEAQSAVATAYKIVHTPAPTLAAMGVAADPLAQRVLDVALAKVPEDRYANAASFCDALAPLVPDGATRRALLTALVDAVLGSQPTLAAPPPDGKPAPSPSNPAPEVPPIPIAATPTLVSIERPRGAYPRATTPHPSDAMAVRERIETHGGTPPPSVASSRPPSHPAATAHPQTPPPPTPARSLPRTSTTSSARRTPWTPRALPAHVRGKCHVRGSLPRAAGRWIARAYGDGAYRDVLDLLPPAVAETYASDAFNALVWYDLEALDAFLEAATATVLAGEADAWRALAAASYDRDLGPLFRSASRTTDAAALLKRAATSWARLYDFGTMRVDEAGSAKIRVRIEGFEAASHALRHVVVGTSEGMLRAAGITDPVMRLMAGDASFARDFEYEVTWTK